MMGNSSKQKQTGAGSYDIESHGQQEKQRQSPNSRIVIYLLIGITILLVCVLAAVVVVGLQLYIKSNSKEVKDMEHMSTDMQTIMPQLKTYIPQITSVMDNAEMSDFNATKLMHQLKEFEVLSDVARDLQTFLPELKTILPQIKTVMDDVELSDLNATKLVHQLKEFDDLADVGRDLQSFLPEVKTILPQIKTMMGDADNNDLNATDLIHQLKDFASLANKLQTNPLSIVMDGAWEANTDMSRWRALALEAADVLLKLSKVDYSVPQPDIKWDAVQDCEGEFDSDFKGKDAEFFSTKDQSKCEGFNVNGVGAAGNGVCVWTGDECENKDDEDKAFRWIRNVQSAAEVILPEEFSTDLQGRFDQYRKFATDFAGDASQLTELKPESAIDLPNWISMLLDHLQPSLLQNVVDATDFLDKQSINKVICDPAKGNEGKQNSCKWPEAGYVSSLDNGFRTGVSIVRTIAKNAHKVWAA